MACRHLLGCVDGYCVQCGALMRKHQIKYDHRMRRLLWNDTVPVLVHGVAVIQSKDLESLSFNVVSGDNVAVLEVKVG